MGNIHRGIVSVDVGGAQIQLRLDTDALCELEALRQRSTTETFLELQGMFAESRLSVSLIRVILLCAMRRARPDASLKDASVLIDEIGIASASKLVSDVIAATFPAPGEHENPT